MSKRQAKQPVSYVEVDSDADLAASDDGLMKSADGDDAAGPAGEGVGSRGKGKGRATSPAKPPQKKTRFTKELTQTVVRRPRQGKEYKPPTLNADLLLNLPFDILVEICRQLDLADLIHLSRTSRAFRNLLLAPSGRQLWAAVRIRDGYFVPQSMSEVAFALLIVGGDCQVCAAEGKPTTYWMFREDECSTAGRDLFVKSELEAVSLKLQELEEDDEQTRNKNQHLRVWTTKSRRSRASALEDGGERADAVETYVEAEKERIKHVQDDVKAIEQSIKAVRTGEAVRKVEAAKAEQRAKEASEKARKEELKASHGWTDNHFNLLAGRRGMRHAWQFSRHKPKVSPSDDRAAWLVFRKKVDAKLAELDFIARNEPGWDARLRCLEGYFDTLKEELSDEVKYALPDFDEFKEIRAVKALWHPEDAQLDASTWPDQKPLVKQVLEEFDESVRINAIRVILAAQTGKALKSLSIKAAKYPVDKYGDEFFGRITASLRAFSFTSYNDIESRFPDVLQHRRAGTKILDFLKEGTCHRRVRAIRAVLDAAGLDEYTVTTDDLKVVGKAFSWPDCPRVYDRKLTMDWTDMVDRLLRQGPSLKDFKAGATVKLKFAMPPPNKGKSRAPVMDDSHLSTLEDDDTNTDSSISADESVVVDGDDDDEGEEDEDEDEHEDEDTDA
ncbi:hypothetical protein JCM10450v2_006864 [Rhodotorula kratochvilovae]